MAIKTHSYLTTLFFICLYFTSNAQYHHFIEPGKTWRELVEGAGVWYEDEYQIYGDTTINTVSYKKLEVVTSTDPSIALPYYSGAVREDTLAKKVFIYFPSDSTERLLYDFDLNVGEQHTFHHCFYLAPIPSNPAVFSVDSIGSYIDQNGQSRKVWYLDYSHIGVVARIVEGVGSNTGIFSYSCHFSAWSDLVCAYKDSAALFINDSPFANYCTPYVSVGLNEDNVGNHSLSIYPNPSNSIITIDFDNITKLSKVKIIAVDQLGRMIPLQPTIQKNKIVIDISALQNGLYFISIETEQTKYVRKIVKENL